jgi:fucose 4-O-acetylase-like acetyltransferase
MKRDTSISICKGLAIILMVIGHAEAPGALSSFIYEFHMPLFFITAGYFFNLKYLNDEATFVKRRFKGLYIPFVKWAFFFLIIHNLMFKLGILNERYGNYMGGVTHPYSWHQLQQNAWNILFSMGGYDEFLAGAFWFFRALLVASIVYLVLYKLLTAADRAITGCRHKDWTQPELSTATAVRVGVAVGALLYLFMLWKTSNQLRIVTLVQGGDRDLMGCFFFGIGFLLRYILKRIPRTWWLTLLYGAVVFACSKWATASMTFRMSLHHVLALPIPALLGFLMTYNISTVIDRHDNILKRFLVYCGDNTLCIFVFHIVAFKAVSLIKIWYYGLNWLQIGCHMVIHEHSQEDLFWILYSIAGVGIPLGVNYLYHRLKAR